ncbi:MAG: cbb3-type cytochrome oxidase subunit 3 [Burkholderiaceae bacterium]
MDLFNINDLRAAVTLVSFITFGCIVAWALSKRNQSAFDEAAMLPFLEEPESSDRATQEVHTKGDLR